MQMKIVASRVECRGFDFHLHHVADTGEEVETIYPLEGLVPLLADLKCAVATMNELIEAPDCPEFERVARLESADSLATH